MRYVHVESIRSRHTTHARRRSPDRKTARWSPDHHMILMKYLLLFNAFRAAAGTRERPKNVWIDFGKPPRTTIYIYIYVYIRASTGPKTKKKTKTSVLPFSQGLVHSECVLRTRTAARRFRMIHVRCKKKKNMLLMSPRRHNNKLNSRTPEREPFAFRTRGVVYEV